MKMDGKTVLITGSTDGVGRYVAARLAADGAKVLIHGRNEARAKTLADEIRGLGHEAPTFYQADLSSLAGARQLAEAVAPITGGSMFSSATPESGRARSAPSDAPTLTDTNCGLP
jgi:NAD(P)-dependent dehydrogenase (short-subunit alcohol dehydrogenase family)